jgi:hypothetical protein
MPACPSPQVDPACLSQLGLGPSVLTRSRANGFLNMLESMKKRARLLAGDLPRFPSLLITAEATSAQGVFAEAQVGALAGWIGWCRLFWFVLFEESCSRDCMCAGEGYVCVG